ncbi:Os06g0149801 [Oryza sativa Japonica Group]|uniref:Os06g0149801 protein n=1 Tax=Oryza sativa subsp. japonica TaxID=39947 RepID=A0A0N7KLJ3_ORYSJ|nr:hypothetical protein EE612_031949 [Oryza sativa]BAS96177.1 Os06g0149801 [Oryza sativa Japonica Group]
MALHSSLACAKRSEFMYLSPPLGKMVTIIFPSYSFLDATFRQAAKLAPDDMPTSKPSSLASLFALAIASCAVTVMISSTIEISRFFGTKPGPIP